MEKPEFVGEVGFERIVEICGKGQRPRVVKVGA
jgi:hypothetical protein